MTLNCCCSTSHEHTLRFPCSKLGGRKGRMGGQTDGHRGGQNPQCILLWQVHDEICEMLNLL